MKPFLCLIRGHIFERVLLRARLSNGAWLNRWTARCTRCGTETACTDREATWRLEEG
jgi:hypothetical protein